MLSDVGIKYYYGKSPQEGHYKLKKEYTDFVVQEVFESLSEYAPLINLEKYYEAESLYNNIPDNLSKEQRKPIYDITNYYPFKSIKCSNNQFKVEKCDKDIFRCTIMKYGLSTSDVSTILADRLGVPFRHIQSSGNKDKIAVTFQEISVHCSFEKLFNYALSLSKNDIYQDKLFGFKEEHSEINDKIVQELSKHMEIKHYECHDKIKIFNIRKGSSIKMGEHRGNHFTIKVRGLKELKRIPDYFYNYFGHQRFGKFLNNHIIGKSILEKRYDEAISYILEEPAQLKTRGSNKNEKAIEDCVAKDQNAEGTQKNLEEEKTDQEKGNDEENQKNEEIEIGVEKLKKYSKIQNFIMRSKSQKHSSRFIIDRMDREARMLYMHAYQSELFNEAINSRIEEGRIFDSDQVQVNDEYKDPSQDSTFEDIYIALEKRNDKFLKGGYRKMVEKFHDFESFEQEDGMVLRFFLSKSTYATVALREIIGDCVWE
jgi:tRNA pseudouridine13 synthase